MSILITERIVRDMMNNPLVDVFLRRDSRTARDVPNGIFKGMSFDLETLNDTECRYLLVWLDVEGINEFSLIPHEDIEQINLYDEGHIE
jgi:hypothetical protein